MLDQVALRSDPDRSELPARHTQIPRRDHLDVPIGDVHGPMVAPGTDGADPFSPDRTAHRPQAPRRPSSRSANPMRETDRASQIQDLLSKLAGLIAEPALPEPRPSPTQKVFLTVAEAAEVLGIGKTTTYALVRSGEIESVLIGRLRRIHIDTVTAYAAELLERQRADNDPPKE